MGRCSSAASSADLLFCCAAVEAEERGYVLCDAALDCEDRRGTVNCSKAPSAVVGVTGLAGWLDDGGGGLLGLLQLPSLVRFFLRKLPRACIKRAGRRQPRGTPGAV